VPDLPEHLQCGLDDSFPGNPGDCTDLPIDAETLARLDQHELDDVNTRESWELRPTGGER